MNNTVIKRIAISLALIICLFGSGCERSVDTSLVLGIHQAPTTFFSPLAQTDVDFMLLRHTVEGLVRLDSNDAPQPGIAKYWTASKDNLSYTFTLRDAHWSDGSNISALDFEYAMKLLVKPETAAPNARYARFIKNADLCMRGAVPADELGVRALSDTELEIQFESPVNESVLLQLLSTPMFAPLPREKYQAMADAGRAEDYAANPNNMLFTGPFVLEPTSEGADTYTLRKNDEYYDEQTILSEQVVLTVQTDPEASWEAFQTGKLDATSVSDDMIQTYKSFGADVQTYFDGQTNVIMLNCERPELANAQVRRALAMSINRERYIKEALQDGSAIAQSLTPPCVTATLSERRIFSDIVQPQFSDNAGAEAQSALTTGLMNMMYDRIEPFEMLCLDDEKSIVQAQYYADCIVETLAIEVLVTPLSEARMAERISVGDYLAACTRITPDYNDPYAMLSLFTQDGRVTYAHYNSAAYDELLAHSQDETLSKQRIDLVAQAERMLMDDMPVIPTIHYAQSWAINPIIVGLTRSAFQLYNFYSVHIENH